MSGDGEEPAFQLDLSVPDKLTDEDRQRAITWLEDLAQQLQEADGKNLAIQVTGLYDDEYPSDDVEEDPPGGSTDSPPPAQPACSSKKAVVNIMVCPGRRPYT